MILLGGMVETQVGFDTSSLFENGFMSIGLESLLNIGYYQLYFTSRNRAASAVQFLFFHGECVGCCTGWKLELGVCKLHVCMSQNTFDLAVGVLLGNSLACNFFIWLMEGCCKSTD